MATEKIQELADEYNIPTEVVEEYIEYMGFETDEVDELNYYGSYKNESDFAEQLVDEGVITDLGRYLYMTGTDMRLLAGEEADNRVDNMDDEEVLEETGDNYTPDEVDDAREYLKSEYYDEIHEELDKDAVGYFVDQFGYREEDLAKQSIFSVDYDKLGDDLQYDYNYIEHDGMVYVFNNYKRGGMMEQGGYNEKDENKLIEKLELANDLISQGKVMKDIDEGRAVKYMPIKLNNEGSLEITIQTKEGGRFKMYHKYKVSITDERYGDETRLQALNRIIKELKSSKVELFAKGGMINHGLKTGDKIVGGKMIGNTIRVRNENLDEEARVDLETGNRTILVHDKTTKKFVEKKK